MLIYIGFALGLVAFAVFTFLNKAVFGAQPQQNEFDDLSNFKNGSFLNLSPTPMMEEDGIYWKVIKFMLNRPKTVNPSTTLPVVKTDLNALDLSKNCLIWFGHSSYLLVLDGKRILVDPIFYNASPVAFFGKPYQMSYNYLPADFPEIDLLIITHDHYDHLDYKTICELKPKINKIVTSKGVDAHLKLWGFDANMISTLNWQEKTTLEGFELTCLPARHFSGRKFKRSETLWSSFVLKTSSLNIYVGGDSGHDTHFTQIGDKYGPFDLAILECGQYGKYWSLIHMLPEETLQASKDLYASSLLPVHWGKFTLSSHPWTEPIERLVNANDDGQQRILTPQIGEVLKLEADNSTDNSTKKWWRE